MTDGLPTGGLTTTGEVGLLLAGWGDGGHPKGLQASPIGELGHP